MKINKAIIPAAGFGTRFLPITKAIPKGMLPIIDKPALQLIVQEVADSGISEICIIVNKFDKSIEQYFNGNANFQIPEKYMSNMQELEEIKSKCKISFMLQHEMKGLGHAVLSAREFADGKPFCVLTGDDIMFNDGAPVTKQLIDAFEKCKKSILGVQKVDPKEVHKYGAIKFSKQNGRFYEVEEIVEKPPFATQPSDVCSLGRYVLVPEIFEYLETQKPAANGEIQLPDAMCRLGRNLGLVAYEFEGKRYDAGDKLGFLQATVEFALKDKKIGKQFADYLDNLK